MEKPEETAGYAPNCSVSLLSSLFKSLSGILIANPRSRVDDCVAVSPHKDCFRAADHSIVNRFGQDKSDPRIYFLAAAVTVLP